MKPPLKSALVVGCSRGLGLETCRFLLASGWSVSGIARSSPTDFSVGDIQFYQADLTSRLQLTQTLSDIVANSGVPDAVVFCQRYRGDSVEMNAEMNCAVNVTCECIQWLSHLPEFGPAAIVMVSSVNAEFISRKVALGYHLAKAAINQIVRYYAVSLGSRGIRVNGVSPGTFTKKETVKSFQEKTSLVRLFQKTVPLGRVCTALEVASVIEFLVSDRSSFVTGQNLSVDGGASLLYQEALAREISGDI